MRKDVDNNFLCQTKFSSRAKKIFMGTFDIGGPCGTRTHDLLLAKQAL